jgi:hypothetical protein
MDHAHAFIQNVSVQCYAFEQRVMQLPSALLGFIVIRCLKRAPSAQPPVWRIKELYSIRRHWECRSEWGNVTLRHFLTPDELGF